MTLFHQNSPQLQNQLKAFPVRLNDVQLINGSQNENDYFVDYDETLDGNFLRRFRKEVLIGCCLGFWRVFLTAKCRNLVLHKVHLGLVEVLRIKRRTCLIFAN